MNQLGLSTFSEQKSSIVISSVEIAQLCEKRHDHVMRDIRNMLAELEIHSPQIWGEYKMSDGRTQPCAFLPKRETLILVSGYRVDLRAKIIDRLDELEKTQQKPTALLPQDYLQALEALVESEKQKQALVLENQTMKPKADFVDHYVEVGTTKTLREVAKILNMPERKMIDYLIGDKLLYRQSNNLLPYQTAQARGLFTVKTGTAEHGHNYTQTRVTSKGVEFIASRYASELMQ